MATETTRGYTATKDQLLKRLSRVEGQVRGVKGMVEEDLAYLHVHPSEHGEHGAGHGEAVNFETEFPSAARYRLFLQFKHAGEVRTVAFTRKVDR